MKIALDAMGGDHAPAAMVAGAVDYAREHSGHEVQLVGATVRIEAELAKLGERPANIVIVEAP